MSQFDSRPETQEHIDVVRRLVDVVAVNLFKRGSLHDRSKLEEPEKALFDEYTPKLRATTYGSPEYEEFRREMGVGLEHHYAENDHHPEHFPPSDPHETGVWVTTEYHPSGDEYTVGHARCNSCDWSVHGDEADVRGAALNHTTENFEPGGVHAMNLIQLTEMLCDWIAASRRHADGDIHQSIKHNARRFSYGPEIEGLLHRSADAILTLEAS